MSRGVTRYVGVLPTGCKQPSFWKQLDELRSDFSKMEDETNKLRERIEYITSSLVPLHRRILLDLALDKVISLVAGTEKMLGWRSRHKAIKHTCQSLGGHGALQARRMRYTPSKEALDFLFTHHDVFRRCNNAVHVPTVDVGEMREGLLDFPADERTRRALGSLFAFTFEEPYM
ncbi:hypothetical protein F5J12DRAFT_817244 [Pisolithus orientalis]|uniref:uncharacterized protein n=1 Tax=Pisolithus orientalis TaxID=936130 RepID=UPI0022248D36|nr:uncharacterized protein F5J12DRAFT_817244 [Pisolithus orientalis]KAI6015292.1 hypothetical protein F5J12DRAFT_817244 [Pisolithus orientalis]